MRLIDADALMDDIERTIENSGCVNHEGDIMDCVRYAPEVNAAPVVRGEWIHGCSDGAGTEYCYCSVCGEDALKDKGGYTEFSAFCPSCGAKMEDKP